MSADFDNLKSFLIASTRSQLATQLAVEQINVKLKLLENRFNRVEKSPNHLLDRINNLQKNIDDALKEMNESTEEMLNSLEKYANG